MTAEDTIMVDEEAVIGSAARWLRGWINGCVGKVKHPTEDGAQEHAARLWVRQGTSYGVYQCQHCSCWHVGHKNRTTARRNRSRSTEQRAARNRKTEAKRRQRRIEDSLLVAALVAATGDGGMRRGTHL